MIPSNALIPAAIQAVISFEMPNDRLKMRPQPVQALEPGGVGIPRARLTLGRATYPRYLGRPQTALLRPRVMHATIGAQFGRRLANEAAARGGKGALELLKDRHREFDTVVKRLGTVVRISDVDLSVWRLHAEQAIHIAWDT